MQNLWTKINKILTPSPAIQMLASVAESGVALAGKLASEQSYFTKYWQTDAISAANVASWLRSITSLNKFTTLLAAVVLDDTLVTEKKLVLPELVTVDNFVKCSLPSKALGCGYFIANGAATMHYLTVCPKALTVLSDFNIKSLFSVTMFNKLANLNSATPLDATSLLNNLIKYYEPRSFA